MKKYIIAGCTGSLFFLVLIIVILMLFGAYDYTLIKILNPTCVDGVLDRNQVAVIKDLSQKGILLTPAEYTNHIVSYYNSIIMLLVGLFAIFSFIGYFSLRTKMKEQIQESLIEMLRDSKEFDVTISENIMGRVTSGFVQNEQLDDIRFDISSLKEEILQIKETSQAKKTIKVISKK